MRDLMTYQDTIDSLLDSFDLDRSERNLRIVRRAITESLREVVAASRWSYFDRHHTIWTSAPYSTGTIAYDHTGGTYERMVTLTTGTWPTWAQYGRLVIGERRYEVDRRVSSTVITLHEESNPGADVASGQEYSIERSQYTLPQNFRRHYQLFDLSLNRYLDVVDPQETREVSSMFTRQTGQPRAASFLSVGEPYASRQIEFGPAPDDAYSYDLFYEAFPREVTIEDEHAGTVTIVAGAVTVAGTSTAFANAHVGAIIRFSPDGTNLPTSKYGYRSSGVTNPYQQQRRIVYRDSATSITVDEAFESSLTSVKYTISDPIDLEQEYLVPAFMRACEAYVSREINSPPDKQSFRNSAKKAAFRLAAENCLVSRMQGLPIGPPSITTTTVQE